MWPNWAVSVLRVALLRMEAPNSGPLVLAADADRCTWLLIGAVRANAGTDMNTMLPINAVATVPPAARAA
jgi:hypothetical protein